MAFGGLRPLELIIKGKDQAGRAFGTVTGRLRAFTSAIFSLRGAAVAFTGVVAGRMVRGILDSFGAQEKAVIALNQALANSGKFSEEASRRIQAAAVEIQKLTTAGDEAITQATATVGELAKRLSVDELIQAQTAIVGIADTFLKGDVEQAALLLGKTLGSTTNALTRYGIQVDANASQSEKLAQVLEASVGLFETSKATAQGFAGFLKQLSNAIDDTKEEIGALIVGLAGVQTHQQGIVGGIQALNAWLAENRGEIIKWGRVWFTTLKAVGVTIWGIVRLAFNVGQAFGNAFEAGVSLIAAAIVTAIDGFTSHLNWLIDQLDKIPGVNIDFRIGKIGAAEFFENGVRAANDFNKQAADVKDTLGDLGRAWEEVARAATKAADAQRMALPSSAVPDAERRRRAAGALTGHPTEAIDTSGGLGLRFSEPTPVVQFPSEEDQAAGLSFLEQLALALDDATNRAEGFREVMGNIVTGVLRGFTDAVAGAFEAYASGAASAGEAFKSAMLGALSSVARGMAEYFLGRATGALAEGLLGNPAAFAAAAKFTAAAAVMSAVAGLASGLARGGSGAGAEAAPAAAAGADAQQTSGAAERQATVIVEGGSTFDLSDPRVRDAWANFIEELSGARVVFRGPGIVGGGT